MVLAVWLIVKGLSAPVFRTLLESQDSATRNDILGERNGRVLGPGASAHRTDPPGLPDPSVRPRRRALRRAGCVKRHCGYGSFAGTSDSPAPGRLGSREGALMENATHAASIVVPTTRITPYMRVRFTTDDSELVIEFRAFNLYPVGPGYGDQVEQLGRDVVPKVRAAL